MTVIQMAEVDEKMVTMRAPVDAVIAVKRIRGELMGVVFGVGRRALTTEKSIKRRRDGANDAEDRKDDDSYSRVHFGGRDPRRADELRRGDDYESIPRRLNKQRHNPQPARFDANIAPLAHEKQGEAVFGSSGCKRNTKEDEGKRPALCPGGTGCPTGSEQKCTECKKLQA